MRVDPAWGPIAVVWAVVLVACGIGLLVFVHRRWRGNYRQWAVDRRGPGIVYLVPAAAAFLVAIGISFVSVSTVAKAMATVAMASLVFGVVTHIWQPRWWGPRWYQQVRRELEAPDQSQYMSLDLVVPGPGVSLGSGELADGLFDGQPPSARWNGYLVDEPNIGLRRYGVREVIERPGVLEVRPAGLAFIPSRLSERLGAGPFVVPIAAREVRQVRVVPAGADPDGLVRRGIQHVPHPRVILQTDRRVFLFSLPRAHERAKTIAEALGCALVT